MFDTEQKIIALPSEINQNHHSDPAEKPVIAKERGAGSYRLSAYYLAKCTSDLPINFLLPTFMFTVLFLSSGLGGPLEFFTMYPVLLLQVLLAQVRATAWQPVLFLYAVCAVLGSRLIGLCYVYLISYTL